ncbi:helix-turn-helix domain-containing protein [Embleya sp. NPDC059259]|uniref:helix-turn-helix domain-containing protein n=1 Tax=unclassified Embleya TaxID=2699296 RepID=UPI0036CA00DD
MGKRTLDPTLDQAATSAERAAAENRLDDERHRLDIAVYRRSVYAGVREGFRPGSREHALAQGLYEHADEQVRARVPHARDAGASVAELAGRLGCSHSTIRRILKP